MITRFHVKNYKALSDVALDLTPIHVLIGPNDSGKTSFLEAIAALCRSTDSVLHDAFAGPWDGPALVTGRDISLPVTVGAITDNPPFGYEFTCRFSPHGRLIHLQSEEFRGPGRLIEFPSKGHRDTFVRRVQVSGEMVSADLRAACDVISAALKGVHYYRWNSKLMALPSAPDSARKFRMEDSGFGLTLLLDDILGYDRERFASLENQFKRIFLQVKSIKLIPQMAYRAPIDVTRPIPMLQQADGKGLYFEFSGNANLVSASQVSDGMLLVLGYLTLLHLPEPPRVILIEEPENGIHPKRLQEVLRILRDLVEGQSHSQVILTTHSPYVLDLFKPEEVTLCRKTDSGVQVHRLSDSKTVREQLDIFSLGEIWTAEGDERIYSTSAPQTEPAP